MSALSPLVTLFDAGRGQPLSLPPELARLYGSLGFPPHPGRPYVISNFVTSLDGVVAFTGAGHSGGGEISGFNAHDQMVMGLLRAAADAVIVGAGTLRGSPRHLWTAEYIFPSLADAYHQVQSARARPEPPLNVIVTGHGELDFSLPVFLSGAVPVLVVTTAAGAKRISALRPPPAVQVATVTGTDRLKARDVLNAVEHAVRADVILVEGGPQLMSGFFAERCLDELFLTLAPQVAGRDDATERPGLVAGKILAPDDPRWGALVGVKQAGSHLFLRYAWESEKRPADAPL
jgi:riboflavin biosynthesis pyrimidine reductase